jgi:hypothetical protein
VVSALHLIAPAELAYGPAMGAAGHCRKRLINESGIEQTVVAFDVTLKMSISQTSQAPVVTHRCGKSWGVRRGPACEFAPSLRGFSFANGSAGLFPVASS